ncbi:hypothetical protein Mal15_07070 [Stieleria maiorica]|uniref:Uncharacterized protein n=1 Tax=Stieleria maiorica TaxID=2795974 RepID=A0A5B9M7I5_9BACT|nr:hypothetical protein Mal15_07070 [Stieleria maiorica]
MMEAPAMMEARRLASNGWSQEGFAESKTRKTLQMQTRTNRTILRSPGSASGVDAVCAAGATPAVRSTEDPWNEETWAPLLRNARPIRIPATPRPQGLHYCSAPL